MLVFLYVEVRVLRRIGRLGYVEARGFIWVVGRVGDVEDDGS